jgi:hypothetical protein
VKPQGRALAKASYQPFQFTVIAARPECWKISFEEVGIALCRTLRDEPDLLNRVISSLESAVLDEIVRRLERNECGQRDMSHRFRRRGIRRSPLQSPCDTWVGGQRIL